MTAADIKDKQLKDTIATGLPTSRAFDAIVSKAQKDLRPPLYLIWKSCYHTNVVPLRPKVGDSIHCYDCDKTVTVTKVETR